MIEVTNLSKSYGPYLAIDDLTFRAREGEILGFLGPNGAGKTTTMRILAGYMPPSSGEARVAGFDVIDESLEVRKRIGYLPENVPLYPEMTVAEYFEYMGALRGVSDLDERVASVAEQVHLEDSIDRFIGNLSKGMRQRVGLGQALIHQPQVLILDEPTIGLDPGQIIEVRNLIKSLKRDRTVLLSTHILSEAQQVCDRVLIINNGRIVAEDSPANLQAQMQGGTRIVILADAPAAKLEGLLSGIAGVQSVSVTGAGGEVQVQTEPSAGDMRAQLARAVVEADYDLLELRASGYTLEDIFLELVREPEASGEAP